MTDSIPKKPL